MLENRENYEKCRFCGNEAEMMMKNSFYVRCTNPCCLLHEFWIHKDKWNGPKKPLKS